MPLPESAPREQLHTRRIECRGYRREDGLWDIEGTLIDTKSFEFFSHVRGEVKPGHPVHQISIRLTIDDDLVIQNAVGCMDSTPYPICGNAAFKVAELKGLKIRPHWTRQAEKLMGGRRGCTHLFELLRPIATTCFQTMSGSSSREDSGYQINPGKVAKQPFFINSCHALAADGDIVKTFWPEFYDGYN